MAVRVSDNLKTQNDSTEFPVAFGDSIWLNKDKTGATENYYSCKGCLYVRKDGIKKRINENELQEYLNNGWSWSNEKKERKNNRMI